MTQKLSVPEFLQAISEAITKYGIGSLVPWPRAIPGIAISTFYPKPNEPMPEHYIGFRTPEEANIFLSWEKLLETYPNYPREPSTEERKHPFLVALNQAMRSTPSERTAKLNPEVTLRLRALCRLTQFVTPDPLNFVMAFAATVRKPRVIVHHPLFGAGTLTDLVDYYDDTQPPFLPIPTGPRLVEDTPPFIALTKDEAVLQKPLSSPKGFKTMGIETFLQAALLDQPLDEVFIYIVLDAEKHLQDESIQDTIREIVFQGQADIRIIKLLILVTSTVFNTPKLTRYMNVVKDQGPQIPEIKEILEEVAAHTRLSLPEASEGIDFESYIGLTEYEIAEVTSLTIISTKSKDKPSRLYDKDIITEYRKSKGL